MMVALARGPARDGAADAWAENGSVKKLEKKMPIKDQLHFEKSFDEKGGQK